MNARMNRMACQMLSSLCAVVCGVWMASVSAEEAVPKHLQVARDIVKNVKPENNLYSNKPRYIRFPGDLFTSEYTVRTDCTGFAEAILDKGLNFTPQFSTRRFPNLYSIIDWVDGVDRGETFDRIKRVQDLQPGDFVLWKYIIPPVGGDPLFNGHIALVDVAPKKIEPQRKPLLEGAVQWELRIIDSATGPMSSDDTRMSANVTAQDSNALKMTKKSGAGSGRIYLYADEEGNILGQASAFIRAKINMQDVDRRIVMARPRYEQIKR